MTDPAYHLATLMSQAAPGNSAMAHQLGGFGNRSIGARMQVLLGRSLGSGVVRFPQVARRSAAQVAQPRQIAGFENGLHSRQRAFAWARCPFLSAMAKGKGRLPLVVVGSPPVAVQAAGMGLVAGSPKGADRTSFAEPKPIVFAAPTLFGRPTIAASAKSRPIVPPGPRLNYAPRRAALLALPNRMTRAGLPVAAPTTQPAAAPGFNRTVRQPERTAAAGHVYLDKTLVGYHLAASITAEQTRAAGRPNISASRFNSSMAAMRPSGAGL